MAVGISFISTQIDTNTIQVQFQNLLPKIKAPNILVIYSMSGA